jgi:uncharacterized protein (DUF2236 family)
LSTDTREDRASGAKPKPKAKVTKEVILGTERRWRRFGEPVPAGASLKDDGTPDYGIFGPGSVVWEVLLHPATIVFENVAQGIMQQLYKPISAGLRDEDPMAKKAKAGTLTFYDAFDRLSRNAGMHAPMWFGDTATARLMAKHLHNIHQHVRGDVIDAGEPELGGYAASEPRDAMWAGLTELHPLLWIYEAFAFRDGRFPHRLEPGQRDRYVAEVAEYCRLLGAEEDQIPTSMPELAALYDNYADLFRHSDTIHIDPETGTNMRKLQGKVMVKNIDRGQLRALRQLIFIFLLWQQPGLGALSGKARQDAGLSPAQSRRAYAARKLALPVVWLMQQRPVERYVTRVMWGPDAVELIASARKLHRQALAERAAAA